MFTCAGEDRLSGFSFRLVDGGGRQIRPLAGAWVGYDFELVFKDVRPRIAAGL